MDHDTKKEKYIVLIIYLINDLHLERIELFDTIEEAREFKKKAEAEPYINHDVFDTSVNILEIKSTNSDAALARLRKDFPKSNFRLAF